MTSLSLFLAFCSDGGLYWAFIEEMNYRWTTIQVIQSLVEILDVERPVWRKTHVLMHDNCPAFVAAESKKVLTHLNIPCLLTSSSSFQALVVEGCFEALKATKIQEKHQ